MADVKMVRGDDTADVCDDDSVKIMEGLGWKRAEPQGKPSDGLNVDQLKAALTEKGITFAADAKKADLQALLDAA